MKKPLRRLVVAALTLALVPAPIVHGAGAKTVDIAIKNGVVTGSKSVRVTRGDTVILRWTSDRPLELHLHGYDLTVRVAPGGRAEMKMEARATGRFPVEVHKPGARGGHAHKPLFHLEVYPE
jgi:hypothetical protein